MKIISLTAQALSAEGFKPFGDVIEADFQSEKHFSINGGLIERFNDLADVDVAQHGGHPLINLAICNHATEFPYKIPLMERHPLGSQAFIPMDDTPMIIAVAPAGDTIIPESIQAFISNGQQGINYRPGIWHMPMSPLKIGIKMLMIDRGGPGHNCDESPLNDVEVIIKAEF